MPMLKGRATSNPRTCRIAGATVLISLNLAFSAALCGPLRLSALEYTHNAGYAEGRRGRREKLLSLHLVPEDSLDHFRIGFVPPAKFVNRERHLDVSESRVRLIKCIVRR